MTAGVRDRSASSSGIYLGFILRNQVVSRDCGIKSRKPTSPPPGCFCDGALSLEGYSSLPQGTGIEEVVASTA